MTPASGPASPGREIHERYPGWLPDDPALRDGPHRPRAPAAAGLGDRRGPPGPALAALARLAAVTGDGEALAVTHGGLVYAIEGHLGGGWARLPNLGGRWVEVTDGRALARRAGDPRRPPRRRRHDPRPDLSDRDVPDPFDQLELDFTSAAPAPRMEVEVVRSARRRKTVQASVVDGRIRVLLPARMTEGGGAPLGRGDAPAPRAAAAAAPRST